MGVTFVAVSALVAAAVAIGVESARLSSSKTFLQDLGDSAALFGATLIREGSLNDDDVSAKVREWMLAQATGGAVALDPAEISIAIDRARGVIRIEAQAEQDLFLPFISDSDQVALTAITEAGVADAAANGGLCGLALDAVEQKAMHFKGDGEIDANECVFWSNSRDSNATHGFGDGGADTQQVCSVGRYSKVGSFAIAPPPEDNCAPQADPYASWTPPPVDWSRCDYGPDPVANFNGGGYDVTLNPGTYCGGLMVGNARNVVFKPGRYYFGGKTNIVADSKISGDGVYLQFSADAEGDIRADTIDLERANDPALKRVLVYKEPGADKPAKFTFQARSDFRAEGVFYLPTDDLAFKVSRRAGADAFAFGAVARLVEFDVEKGDTLALKPLIAIRNGAADADAEDTVRLTQ